MHRMESMACRLKPSPQVSHTSPKSAFALHARGRSQANAAKDLGVLKDSQVCPVAMNTLPRDATTFLLCQKVKGDDISYLRIWPFHSKTESLSSQISRNHTK